MPRQISVQALLQQEQRGQEDGLLESKQEDQERKQENAQLGFADCGSGSIQQELNLNREGLSDSWLGNTTQSFSG